MLHAVIVAGGSGTRFWPASRRDRPKQFLSLAGQATLLQQAHERARLLVDPGRIHVVTSEVQARGVAEQLPDLSERNLIAEPEPRDTAIAMGLAAGLIAARDPDAVLLVTPADHVIGPPEAFAQTVSEAAALAEQRRVIVTFGVAPTHPHTGYGYVQRGAALEHAGERPAWIVERFCEKPDRATAEAYLQAGDTLWNSGLFVWPAAVVLTALRDHLPRTAQAIDRIVAAWGTDRQAAVFAEEYASVEKISIDYGVLERADEVVVVEAGFSWSDVGSWSALSGLDAADEHGNTVRGARLVGVGARDMTVLGDPGHLVAAIGVEGLVIVQTRDATLICPRERAEEVRTLVDELRRAPDLEPYT